MSAVEAVLAEKVTGWEAPGSWEGVVGGRILALAEWDTDQFRDVADGAGSQSVEQVTTAREGAEHLISRYRGLMSRVEVAFVAAHEATRPACQELNDEDQRIVRVATENLVLGFVLYYGLCEPLGDMVRVLTYPFVGVGRTPGQLRAVAA